MSQIIWYCLGEQKWDYIVIFLLLFSAIVLLLDSFYNFMPAIDVLNIGKRGYRIISMVLLILALYVVIGLYSEFNYITVSKDNITLIYLKPRLPVKIQLSQVSRYEIKVPPKVPENRRVIIYLKNGRRYKSTYSGPKYRENFNKAIEELDKILNK